MIIKPDGKVGIGVDSPQSLLHIKNTDSNSLIRIEADRTSGSTNYEAGIEFWNNEGDTSTNTTTYPSSKIISGFDTGGWDSCFIRFKTHHSTSNNLVDTMTIKGPNVGIGTTSPSGKLHIKDGNFRIEQTGTNNNTLIINPNNHNNGVDI